MNDLRSAGWSSKHRTLPRFFCAKHRGWEVCSWRWGLQEAESPAESPASDSPAPSHWRRFRSWRRTRWWESWRRSVVNFAGWLWIWGIPVVFLLGDFQRNFMGIWEMKCDDFGPRHAMLKSPGTESSAWTNVWRLFSTMSMMKTNQHKKGSTHGIIIESYHKNRDYDMLDYVI